MNLMLALSRIILSALLAGSASVLHGQEPAKSNYRFKSEITKALEADTSEFRFQTAATAFSFSGQYKLALQYADKDPGEVSTISKSLEQEFMSRYKPVDARQFILEKAKQSKVLIINEAHYNARNRVFVTSLLRELHKIGYTYFAAETFVNDTALFGHRHPSLQSGYYTREPSFGNMVREALARGFTLFPYETNRFGEAKDREIDQAKNLSKLLVEQPSTKIIIYCGYDHLREDSLPTWGRALAGRLKEYTGIDPYTIDQVALSEHTDKSLENPYYHLVKANEYSILVDKQGQPFHIKGVDACLYTPRAIYRSNRPNWLFENRRKTLFITPGKSALRYPILVKVFVQGDDPASAVPADIIEIEKASDFESTALSVPAHTNIFIVMEDSTGNKEIRQIPKKEPTARPFVRKHPLP